MLARDVMKQSPSACAPETDLATAVNIMWKRDCGFLPVVNAQGTVVGAVTDRDICMAAGPKRRALSRISVGEAMSRPAISCFPDDDLNAVLATMAKFHVRRMPVLSRSGRLEGVLSVDDILAARSRHGAPTAADIVAAMRKICMPRPRFAAAE
jgi:CBS domain-containing protein